MKLPILFLCLMSLFTPAFAEENMNVVERKTCEQIKTEIANLSTIENPTAEQQAELKQLNLQQRSYCAIKGNGRRTVSRPTATVTETPENVNVQATNIDVLDEYIATKKANCDKLNAEIERLKPEETKAYLVTEMQKYYNADCVTITPSATAVAEPVTVVAAPAKTDEEWAAEYDANIAAGLCGDGTKPNRFGCCTGEVFKDLGDEGFACCPKVGDGLCFPPMK